MTIGRKRVQVLLTGFFVLMLSACALNVSGKPPTKLQGEAEQTDRHCDVLNYYDALISMTADELKQEQLMLREQLDQNKNVCDSLRLVMLLGLPEAGAKDEKEALQLVKEILVGEQYLAQKDRQIAQLLKDQVQWRSKLRVNQQSLRSMLKEQRAASLNLLERLAEAQSKLTQLKKIDKNINEQEQEISAPSTDKIPHEPK